MRYRFSALTVKRTSERTLNLTDKYMSKEVSFFKFIYI